MRKYNKIIGGFQTIINKLDKLTVKCNKKAIKLAAKSAKLQIKREGEIAEGYIAKTASTNLKSIFPKAPAKKG